MQLHNEKIESVDKTDEFPEFELNDLTHPLEHAFLKDVVLMQISLFHLQGDCPYLSLIFE